MILRPNPIHSSRLTYVAAERMLVCEASDLGPLNGPSIFGRVYDDACDEGLTVISARTGREIVFAVEHVERDAEGDLLWWDLLPADLRTRRESAISVRVFND